MSSEYENNFIEALRNYGLVRQKKVLEPIALLTNRFLENNSLFHSILCVAALFVIIATYAEARNLTLFSFHPVCMSIGTLIFLAEGIVTYRNKKLAEILSPIMSHSSRIKYRSLHSSLQVIGSSFLALGLLFILSHKAKWKKSIVPGTIHSYLGSICLGLIILQVFTGYEKVENLVKNNTKSRRWHGDLGLALWDCLILTCLTGCLSYFMFFSVFNLITELLIICVWIMVHAQVKRRADEFSKEATDDEKASIQTTALEVGNSQHEK